MAKGLLKLFNVMFSIGFIGFGGGNALIPVLHRKAVVENKLLTDEEYNEDVLMASITPGALPVEVAGGIGSRLYGWKGMLVGAYGISLPGVICTILLLILFETVDENILRQIRYAAVGISAYVCALLLEYVKGTFNIKLNANFNKKGLFDILTVIVVAVLTSGKNIHRIFGIQTTPLFGLASIDIFILVFFLIFSNGIRLKVFRLVVSCIVGIMYIAFKSKGIPIYSDSGFIFGYIVMGVMSSLGLGECANNQKSHIVLETSQKRRIKDIVAVAAVVVVCFIPTIWVSKNSFHYAFKGILSTLVSFGGGDAYLTVADNMFIDTGMILENDFYGKIVQIVNILPGSILCKTLGGIGFLIGKGDSGKVIGGIIVAIFGYAISIFVSCGIFSIIHICYGELKNVTVFVAIKNIIRPIVSGLMFNVALSLVYQTMTVQGENYIGISLIIMLILCVVGSIMLYKNMDNIKIIVVVSAISLITCNLLKYIK